MSRLLTAVQLDLRLQQRYGFYYAAAFVTLVWIAIVRFLPAWTLSLAMPFIIFTDLATVGFFFIAGTVLFEKGEQTLFAVVVTPLRFWEYLTSKLATLTLLAIVISLIVVVAGYGLGFNLLLLVLGVALLSLITLLLGFIAVSPFNSISSFIIPSQVFLLPLGLPLIHYFGWWPNPIFYLIPTQGSLLLLRSAFESIETWQMIYAVVYQLLWVSVLTWVAGRTFDRYVVAGEGGR
jgi:fluoroquinolone transport system permease protein